MSDSVKTKSFAAVSARRVLETTTFGFSCILSDRSFHLKLYQAIHFNRIFHRQFLDKRLDKTRYYHRGGCFLAETAGHQVEELLFTDFAHRSFVPDGNI